MALPSIHKHNDGLIHGYDDALFVRPALSRAPRFMNMKRGRLMRALSGRFGVYFARGGSCVFLDWNYCASPRRAIMRMLRCSEKMDLNSKRGATRWAARRALCAHQSARARASCSSGTEMMCRPMQKRGKRDRCGPRECARETPDEWDNADARWGGGGGSGWGRMGRVISD